MILIFATFGLKPTSAYRTYVGLYSFTIDALFGLLVGAGLLLLRAFNDTTKWSDVSSENKWLSILSATIFTLGNLYPICAIWIPPGKTQGPFSGIDFWIIGTVGFSVVVAGMIYWAVFRYIVPCVKESDLKVERVLVTGNEGGETVVTNEIVSINWEDWDR